ncbi:kinase-like domain-containing protein, partial [Gigaspora rosea]
MEYTAAFTQDQTNTNLLDVYNSPSIEWLTVPTYNYEYQTDYLSTEWFIQDNEDQINEYPFMEWNANFTSITQDSENKPNAEYPFIEWNANFTSITQEYENKTNAEYPFMEWNAKFTSSTHEYENKTDTENPFMEWNANFTSFTQECENKTNVDNTKSVKKNEDPASLVSRRKQNPKCKKCNIRKGHYDENSSQCKDCHRASLRILSGNKLIDDFIESSQTLYIIRCNSSKLEFIPYNQFTNIKYLAKGGFSKIYKATWIDGPIIRWCPKKQKYSRKGNYDVVLKSLNNSDQMDSNCLNELKNFFLCKKKIIYNEIFLHQYLGITQHPETRNYMMVIEFAQNGDLHYYLNKNMNTLSLLEKLNMLHKIASGLEIIHKYKIVHRDLHSGNILINITGKPAVADLGISKPMNTSSDKNAIYGVIPYVAPE